MAASSSLVTPLHHAVKYDGRILRYKSKENLHKSQVVIKEEGLSHSDERFDARQYKTPAFAEATARLLKTLKVPTWHPMPDVAQVNIFKVSGSLTNAVFFVSHPDARTVLLRIYGPSSGDLISRPEELHMLHVLSSVYRIGPRVYGTFGNGRVEEYFESQALTAQEMRDPTVSGWIASRMAELHCVDIAKVVEGNYSGEVVKKNIKQWIAPARDVLLSADDDFRAKFDMDLFLKEWDSYWQWLLKWEENHTPSPRVFAHNDAQYGNLLRLKHNKPSRPAHHQIIVVDFEYASPNPAAFDIANHFHEWTANYHSSNPSVLDPSLYPTLVQRQRFYAAYLKMLAEREEATLQTVELEQKAQVLDQQVLAWSPSSHAMWALWGIVQGREDVLAAKNGTASSGSEFDYLTYSLCRVESFRRECRALGVPAPQ